MSDDTQGYLVIDTETSGLFDFSKEADADGQPRMATCALVWLDQNYDVEMYADLPIKPDGWELTPAAVAVNGLTMEYLLNHGVPVQMALDRYTKAIVEDRRVVIAHNAQFDACFLRELLRGFKPGHLDWLDSLTVYKDRRPYPHKLANAILAYELEDKVQNSHRAIDDVLALFEVLKAMDEERDDLGSYVNLFGYNPKYGVSGRRIIGVRYEPQGFNKSITRPEQTLPARMSRR